MNSSNLTKEENKLLRELSENRNIRVMKLDKGGGIVLMDSHKMGSKTSKKEISADPALQFRPHLNSHPQHATNNIIPIDDAENEPQFQRAIPTRASLKCPRGSVVSFHDIQYSVKIVSGPLCKRKVVVKKILHGVNGIMRPGLNAILGPTGSGKSSLLDVLAARKDPSGMSGEVLIDGQPQPPNFKCISGYVVQDDVVMGTLTVKENLLFSAALRLPDSISKAEKEERVDQVINELGLTKVANSKVGTELIRGVSGGERKRTNIGMELITEPPVLFLDEPTTGLDASTANAVLILLKRLSRRGRTIIFSIHQPRYSIFKLFDTLTLLASGKVMYHGPAAEALGFFQSIGYECESFNNPADFFLDVINGDSTAVTLNKEETLKDDMYETIDSETNKSQNREESGGENADPEHIDQSLVDKLSNEYLKSLQCRNTEDALKAIEKSSGGIKKKRTIFRQITYATSFPVQFYWVAQRAFKNLVRSPQASIAQVMVSIILGLIVGAIFFGAPLDTSGIQNRVGSLFFITTNQCFSSVSAIELFVKDKKLFIHQYISGYYRVSAYFLALLAGDLLPIRTIPAVVFSCITYWMIGYQRLPGNFFFFMLTLVCLSYTATAMSLAISAGMDIVAIANLMITVCFVFMIIYSGLLVNLPSVMGWLNWLKYFSIPRYGLTALQVNEFRGLYFCGEKPVNLTGFQTDLNNCTQSSSTFTKTCYGETYLCNQGIGNQDWDMWQNIVALVCMTIIFLAITYCKLRFMRKFT
ncbi:broad substrate specificity ATP-binding cassette transporter ABCG2-like [Protopterus annectens]|uniref:broad substrate specificity ATP-binding cassette transporter ABCG2-like n=1 Tax=Protopterus annectens TaxID=7888 RepID=UPI001CF9E45B|nr:broad substrate specificity ATP-binding cassette transporter ABCG2-like [Protopterus annectens]